MPITAVVTATEKLADAEKHMMSTPRARVARIRSAEPAVNGRESQQMPLGDRYYSEHDNAAAQLAVPHLCKVSTLLKQFGCFGLRVKIAPAWYCGGSLQFPWVAPMFGESILAR